MEREKFVSEIFEEAVEQTLKERGLNYMTLEFGWASSRDFDFEETTGFSSSPCGCCGTQRPGERFKVMAKDFDGNCVEFSGCSDCADYANDGNTPLEWTK